MPKGQTRKYVELHEPALDANGKMEKRVGPVALIRWKQLPHLSQIGIHDKANENFLAYVNEYEKKYLLLEIISDKIVVIKIADGW